MWHITWPVKKGSAADDVARTLSISESTVRRANKTVWEVLDYLNPLQLDNLEAIVVDEKYLGERLKFITVVTNKIGEILYIGKGKGEDSLKTFFDLLTAAQKQAIKVVGAD
ncbi:MAG: transposase, partial [Akkermansia sp.]|nr:transposase [Akkermansia sp.]